jgi:hypothetical protein
MRTASLESVTNVRLRLQPTARFCWWSGGEVEFNRVGSIGVILAAAVATYFWAFLHATQLQQLNQINQPLLSISFYSLQKQKATDSCIDHVSGFHVFAMVLCLVRLTGSQLHSLVVKLNFEDEPFRAGVAPSAHRHKLDAIRVRTGRQANERHLHFERNVSIAAKQVLLVVRAGVKPVANAQDLHHEAVGSLAEVLGSNRSLVGGVAVVVIPWPERREVFEGAYRFAMQSYKETPNVVE